MEVLINRVKEFIAGRNRLLESAQTRVQELEAQRDEAVAERDILRREVEQWRAFAAETLNDPQTAQVSGAASDPAPAQTRCRPHRPGQSEVVR